MKIRKQVVLILVIFIQSMMLRSTINAQTSEFHHGDTLTIIAPRDGERVLVNPMAEGRVSISNSIVWIVVHPMAVADYWVQQPGTANNNGDWRCLINVGREGTVDTGKYFEIRAFVYPNRTLRNGLVLESWPDARIKSDIITVKRR